MSGGTAMADYRFDLYKLLVEEARDARGARRALSNIFMTANLGGVGALGFLAKGDSHLHPALLVWCVVALVLVCMIWSTSNSYYNRILTAKYVIINRLENELGETPMQNEWAALQSRRGFRWFTLERAMPALFIIGYFVFLIYQTTMADVQSMFDAAFAPIEPLLRQIGLVK